MYGKKSTRGFTLVEVLVASVIALIMSGVIIALLMVVQRSFSTGMAFMEVHSGARLAMDMMVRDMKWARQIATSVTVGGTTYTTGNNVLVLDIPSIDAAGNIIASTYDKIVYHLTAATPNQIERIVSPDAASNRPAERKIIANNVNVLSFSSGGVGLSAIANLQTVTQISVAVTTLKAVRGTQSVQESLTTGVALRNFL
jgi:prepilin-type N-terminal cleavage/methylation domain-containing protein